jgi:transcriptional regulator with XRE-family HTH domain
MRPFGELLAEALANRQMTQKAFAQRTKTPISNLNEVVTGVRKPPLRRLPKWLEVLEVPAREREMWRQAAAVAHAKPEIREVIETLMKDKAFLQSMLDKAQGSEPKAG